MVKNEYSCINCELGIETDSEFCPRCGILFVNDVFCITHTHIKAAGVCVICAQPFCDLCTNDKHNVILCSSHSGYEIYEGMAKVIGTSDEVKIQHFKSIFEESGLHPFVYSRKSSPMHLGGTDYSLFRASGDFNGHIINEIKLMVPCGEVLEAEKLIAEIEN